MGPGASLHAYDIGVLVVYFVFVVGVGVWVSSSGGQGWQGRQTHTLISSWPRSWGQGQAGEPHHPPFTDWQTVSVTPREGCALPVVTQ